MYVAIFRLEFLIPGVRTIKERRQVVSSLKDRLKRSENFSVVDLSAGCDLVVARLGAAFTASSFKAAEEAGEKLLSIVEKAGVQLLHFEKDVIFLERD